MICVSPLDMSSHSGGHSSDETKLEQTLANFVAVTILSIGRIAYSILAAIFSILFSLAG